MKNVICNSLTPLFVFALFIGLMTGSRWMAADEKAKEAKEQQMREREVRARLWISLKLQGLQELADGNCTLPQVSEQLIDLLDPNCEATLRKSFPAETIEQSMALQIIGNVGMMPLEPAKADEVRQRLEKEFEQMKASARSNAK